MFKHHTHKQPQLTSHVYTRAISFILPEARRIGSQHIPFTACVSPKMRRVMIPNHLLCYDVVEVSLSELIFFLHEHVAPKLAVSFVFRLSIHVDEDDLKIKSSRGAAAAAEGKGAMIIERTLEKCKQTFPFLEKLAFKTVWAAPFSGGGSARLPRFFQQLCSFERLQSLCLDFYDAVVDPGTLAALSKLPLKEFKAYLDIPALDILFAPPSEADANKTRVRHAMFPLVSSLGYGILGHGKELGGPAPLFCKIARSLIVRQLRDLHQMGGFFSDGNKSLPPDISLEPFWAVETFGPGLLEDLDFDASSADRLAADLQYAFGNATEIGGSFLNSATLPKDLSTLDLSGLGQLEYLGSNAFGYLRTSVEGQDVRVILPPNLKRIGQCFAPYSSIAEIEWPRGTLEEVDCEDLLSESRIEIFDSTVFLRTLPSGGTRSTVCGSLNYVFDACEKLVRLDLSGFRGVVVLGTCFAAHCPVLNFVDGMDALQQVEKIEMGFLADTPSLEHCDFAALISLLFAPCDEPELDEVPHGPNALLPGLLGDSALEDVGKKILWEIIQGNVMKRRDQLVADKIQGAVPCKSQEGTK